MKKFFALLLVILLLSGCVSADPQIDPNIVTMEIVDYDSKSVSFTVMNNSKNRIEFGNSYELEYKEHENWVPVQEIEETFFTMIAYGLDTGEEKSFSENLEMRYGALKQGTYRIVKEVRFLNEDGEDCGGQQISAEFEIE